MKKYEKPIQPISLTEYPFYPIFLFLIVFSKAYCNKVWYFNVMQSRMQKCEKNSKKRVKWGWLEHFAVFKIQNNTFEGSIFTHFYPFYPLPL